jgi:vacuolar-type H+-ATPase subunit F/Vma7
MRQLVKGDTHKALLKRCNELLTEKGVKAVLLAQTDFTPNVLYVNRTDMVNVFRTTVSIPEAPGGAYENCRKYIEELIGVSILWNKLDDTYFVISDFIEEV